MPKKFIMYMTFNLKLLPYRKLRLQTVKILCRKLTLPIVFLLTDLNHRIQFFNVYVLLIISTSNKFLSSPLTNLKIKFSVLISLSCHQWPFLLISKTFKIVHSIIVILLIYIYIIFYTIVHIRN